MLGHVTLLLLTTVMMAPSGQNIRRAKRTVASDMRELLPQLEDATPKYLQPRRKAARGRSRKTQKEVEEHTVDIKKPKGLEMEAEISVDRHGETDDGGVLIAVICLGVLIICVLIAAAVVTWYKKHPRDPKGGRPRFMRFGVNNSSSSRRRLARDSFTSSGPFTSSSESSWHHKHSPATGGRNNSYSPHMDRRAHVVTRHSPVKTPLIDFGGDFSLSTPALNERTSLLLPGRSYRDKNPLPFASHGVNFPNYDYGHRGRHETCSPVVYHARYNSSLPCECRGRSYSFSPHAGRGRHNSCSPPPRAGRNGSYSPFERHRRSNSPAPTRDQALVGAYSSYWSPFHIWIPSTCGQAEIPVIDTCRTDKSTLGGDWQSTVNSNSLSSVSLAWNQTHKRGNTWSAVGRTMIMSYSSDDEPEKKSPRYTVGDHSKGKYIAKRNRKSSAKNAENISLIRTEADSGSLWPNSQPDSFPAFPRTTKPLPRIPRKTSSTLGQNYRPDEQKKTKSNTRGQILSGISTKTSCTVHGKAATLPVKPLPRRRKSIQSISQQILPSKPRDAARVSHTAREVPTKVQRKETSHTADGGDKITGQSRRLRNSSGVREKVRPSPPPRQRVVSSSQASRDKTSTSVARAENPPSSKLEKQLKTAFRSAVSETKPETRRPNKAVPERDSSKKTSRTAASSHKNLPADSAAKYNEKIKKTASSRSREQSRNTEIDFSRCRSFTETSEASTAKQHKTPRSLTENRKCNASHSRKQETSTAHENNKNRVKSNPKTSETNDDPASKKTSNSQQGHQHSSTKEKASVAARKGKIGTVSQAALVTQKVAHGQMTTIKPGREAPSTSPTRTRTSSNSNGRKETLSKTAERQEVSRSLMAKQDKDDSTMKNAANSSLSKKSKDREHIASHASKSKTFRTSETVATTDPRVASSKSVKLASSSCNTQQIGTCPHGAQSHSHNQDDLRSTSKTPLSTSVSKLKCREKSVRPHESKAPAQKALSRSAAGGKVGSVSSQSESNIAKQASETCSERSISISKSEGRVSSKSSFPAVDVTYEKIKECTPSSTHNYQKNPLDMISAASRTTGKDKQKDLSSKSKDQEEAVNTKSRHIHTEPEQEGHTNHTSQASVHGGKTSFKTRSQRKSDQHSGANHEMLTPEGRKIGAASCNDAYKTPPSTTDMKGTAVSSWIRKKNFEGNECEYKTRNESITDRERGKDAPVRESSSLFPPTSLDKADLISSCGKGILRSQSDGRIHNRSCHHEFEIPDSKERAKLYLRCASRCETRAANVSPCKTRQHRKRSSRSRQRRDDSAAVKDPAGARGSSKKQTSGKYSPHKHRKSRVSPCKRKLRSDHPTKEGKSHVKHSGDNEKLDKHNLTMHKSTKPVSSMPRSSNRGHRLQTTVTSDIGSAHTGDRFIFVRNESGKGFVRKKGELLHKDNEQTPSKPTDSKEGTNKFSFSKELTWPATTASSFLWKSDKQGLDPNFPRFTCKQQSLFKFNDSNRLSASTGLQSDTNRPSMTTEHQNNGSRFPVTEGLQSGAANILTTDGLQGSQNTRQIPFGTATVSPDDHYNQAPVAIFASLSSSSSDSYQQPAWLDSSGSFQRLAATGVLSSSCTSFLNSQSRKGSEWKDPSSTWSLVAPGPLCRKRLSTYHAQTPLSPLQTAARGTSTPLHLVMPGSCPQNFGLHAFPGQQSVPPFLYVPSSGGSQSIPPTFRFPNNPVFNAGIYNTRMPIFGQ